MSLVKCRLKMILILKLTLFSPGFIEGDIRAEIDQLFILFILYVCILIHANIIHPSWT